MYEPFFYTLLRLPEDLTDPSYYDLLGLTPGPATRQQVKAALEATRRRLRGNIPHPQFIPMCVIVEQELEKAAGVLSDAKQKAAYDNEIALPPPIGKTDVRKQALALLRKEVRPDGTIPEKRRNELARELVGLGLETDEVRKIFSRIPATEVKQYPKRALKFLKASATMAVRQEGPQLSEKTLKALRATGANLGLSDNQINHVLKKVLSKAEEAPPPLPPQDDDAPPPMPRVASDPGHTQQASAYTQTEYEPAGTYPQADYTQPTAADQYSAAAALKRRRSGGGGMGIGLAFLAVLAIGAGIYFSGKKPAKTPTPKQKTAAATAAATPPAAPALAQTRGRASATRKTPRKPVTIAVAIPEIDRALGGLDFFSKGLANPAVTSELNVAQHLFTIARIDFVNSLLAARLAGKQAPTLGQPVTKLFKPLDTILMKETVPVLRPPAPPEVIALVKDETPAITTDELKRMVGGSAAEARLAMQLVPRKLPADMREVIDNELKRGSKEVKFAILHGLAGLKGTAPGRLMMVGLNSTLPDVAHLASVLLSRKYPDAVLANLKLPLRNTAQQRKSAQEAWDQTLSYSDSTRGGGTARHMSTGILAQPVTAKAEEPDEALPAGLAPYRFPFPITKYLSMDIGMVHATKDTLGAFSWTQRAGGTFSPAQLPVIRQDAVKQWLAGTTALVDALVHVLESHPKAKEYMIVIDEIRSRARAYALISPNDIQRIAANYEACGSLLVLVAKLLDPDGKEKTMVDLIEETFRADDDAAGDVLKQIAARDMRCARLLAVCCKLKEKAK